jgi:hypothetical protein
MKSIIRTWLLQGDRIQEELTQVCIEYKEFVSHQHDAMTGLQRLEREKRGQMLRRRIWILNIKLGGRPCD